MEKSCSEVEDNDYRTGTYCEPTTLAGTPGIRVAYTTTANANIPQNMRNVPVIDYIIYNGSWAYLLSYFHPAGYPNEINAFETIATSLKIND